MDKSKDIVQEVFLSILEKKKLDHIQDLKSYLFKSVINNSLKHIEREKRFQPLENGIVKAIPTENSMESMIISSEGKEELLSEINILPTKCKEVFVLCVLEGMSYKDAGIKQGVSVNTVKTQIKKSYKILRNSLKNKTILFFSIKNSIFS